VVRLPMVVRWGARAVVRPVGRSRVLRSVAGRATRYCLLNEPVGPRGNSVRAARERRKKTPGKHESEGGDWTRTFPGATGRFGAAPQPPVVCGVLRGGRIGQIVAWVKPDRHRLGPPLLCSGGWSVIAPY